MAALLLVAASPAQAETVDIATAMALETGVVRPSHPKAEGEVRRERRLQLQGLGVKARMDPATTLETGYRVGAGASNGPFLKLRHEFATR